MVDFVSSSVTNDNPGNHPVTNDNPGNHPANNNNPDNDILNKPNSFDLSPDRVKEVGRYYTESRDNVVTVEKVGKAVNFAIRQWLTDDPDEQTFKQRLSESCILYGIKPGDINILNNKSINSCNENLTQIKRDTIANLKKNNDGAAIDNIDDATVEKHIDIQKIIFDTLKNCLDNNGNFHILNFISDLPNKLNNKMWDTQYSREVNVAQLMDATWITPYYKTVSVEELIDQDSGDTIQKQFPKDVFDKLRTTDGWLQKNNAFEIAQYAIIELLHEKKINLEIYKNEMSEGKSQDFNKSKMYATPYRNEDGTSDNEYKTIRIIYYPDPVKHYDYVKQDAPIDVTNWTDEHIIKVKDDGLCFLNSVIGALDDPNVFNSIDDLFDSVIPRVKDKWDIEEQTYLCSLTTEKMNLYITDETESSTI
jgi:hypothetical protein